MSYPLHEGDQASTLFWFLQVKKNTYYSHNKQLNLKAYNTAKCSPELACRPQLQGLLSGRALEYGKEELLILLWDEHKDKPMCAEETMNTPLLKLGLHE